MTWKQNKIENNTKIKKVMLQTMEKKNQRIIVIVFMFHLLLLYNFFYFSFLLSVFHLSKIHL